MSISMLNRHIHTLRKRIRHFEERFEQEKHYKVREEIIDAWPAVIMRQSVKLSVLSTHRAFSFFLCVCVHAWHGVS